MIFKLMKHEYKASYKIFLLMYLTVALATIFIYGSFQWGNDILQALSAFILTLGVVPVVVIYFTTIFNSYTRSVYADEAYLTHTLPVKGRQILLSKWALASFWGILTGIVGCLCGGALMLMLMGNEITWYEIKMGIQYFFQMVGFSNCMLIAIIIILTAIQFLVKVYFAIAISKLPVITKFNNLVGVLVFLICTFFQDKLYSAIADQIPAPEAYMGTVTIENTAEVLSEALSVFSVFHIIFTIAFAVLYFVLTAYLLERKLHIR